MTCDVDERWNGPPPKCEPILCDPPTAVAHSSIHIEEIDEEEKGLIRTNFNRSLLVGSIVTYTCEKGYRPVGFRQILCLATGLYDHAAPTCTGTLKQHISSHVIRTRTAHSSFHFSEEPRTTMTIPSRATLRPSTPKVRPYLTPRVRTTTSTVGTSSTTSLPSRNIPNTAELPATVRETVSKRPTVGLNRPASPSSTVLHDAGSDHPQDNEISGSGVDHAQAGIGAAVPEPSGPFRVDSADLPGGTHQAKLNLGAVIALGVFGGFVFLAAVITTVVILIRR